MSPACSLVLTPVSLHLLQGLIVFNLTNFKRKYGANKEENKVIQLKLGFGKLVVCRATCRTNCGVPTHDASD